MVSDMSRKSLSTLIFFLFVALAIVLLSSDRGVSGVMEDIGDLISRLFV
jgi:hypothetical protein